ncbi:class I SAM-dependent methyltransferase [Rhodococcus sp. NPDC003348]
MIRGLRRTARLKLQRALAEVIHDASVQARQEQENRHDQLLADLAATSGELNRVLAELEAARGQIATVREYLAELEHRARRDLPYALDVRACAESAAFVVEHMPTTAVRRHPHETLRLALSRARVDGLALEFGVAGGTSLRIIADALPRVYGFDVFTGLPETWRTGFPAGEFAQPAIPNVPGAQIVPGLFADTLPQFLAEHPGPVAFAHLDADLYSSTSTVLHLIADRLVPGTVLVFDEFFNYPGWQAHEYRAWTELVERTGLRFEYLAYTADDEQVAVRVCD